MNESQLRAILENGFTFQQGEGKPCCVEGCKNMAEALVFPYGDAELLFAGKYEEYFDDSQNQPSFHLCNLHLFAWGYNDLESEVALLLDVSGNGRHLVATGG